MSASDVVSLLTANARAELDPQEQAAVDQMIRFDARLEKRGWVLVPPLCRHDFLVWSYLPSFVAQSEAHDDVNVTFIEVLMGMEDTWSVDALQIRVRLVGSEKQPRRIGYRELIPALPDIEAVRIGDPAPAALGDAPEGSPQD